jgi:hypothetical protein
MNTTNRHGHDHPVDERRWQAQERARLAAAGVDAGEVDALDLRLARALRTAPAVDLPPDFAAHMAALARAPAAEGTQLEQRLLRGLGWALGLSSAATVAWFGRAWPSALAEVLPGGADAVGWTVLAAVCLLANWGWGQLREATLRASGRTA